MKYIALIVN